jgi:hypothetical protein
MNFDECVNIFLPVWIVSPSFWKSGVYFTDQRSFDTAKEGVVEFWDTWAEATCGVAKLRTG